MPVQFCSGFSKMEKSKVCRNLFGAPNHEDLRKDLDSQLKALSSQTSIHMKKTWNFDPDMDSGLDGRYEWSLLQDEDVPAYLKRPYRPTKFRSVRKSVERSSHLDTPPSSPTCPSPVAVLARLQGSSVTSTEDDLAEEIENIRRENESTPEARIVPVSVKQTKIGDYMRVKKPSKRRLEDDLSEEQPSPKSQRI